MKTQQIEFIESVQRAITLAQEAKVRIITALEIGGVVNERASLEYAEALQKFIEAGLSMAWRVQIAFLVKA